MIHKIKKILSRLRIVATIGAPGGLEIKGINESTVEICALLHKGKSTKKRSLIGYVIPDWVKHWKYSFKSPQKDDHCAIVLARYKHRGGRFAVDKKVKITIEEIK